MSDLPLFRWSETPRPDRRERPRTYQRCLRRPAVALAALASALALTIIMPPRPLLVWNASASAPIGLYAVAAGAPVATGDMVIARLPEPWRRFAARRHYLPANVPLVKRVAAEPGDRVCAIRDTITVEDRAVAVRRERDGQGRPMPRWQGCLTLRHGATLLLMPDPASFDGRYFGPTKRDDVVGKARSLWRR
jgi:conjugative transfer signal peptidase TraF